MPDTTLLWGKRLPEGAYLPLQAHLVDTACALEAVYNLWLTSAFKERYSQTLQTGTLLELLTYAAGTHDLGKASPFFQSQNLTQNSHLFKDKESELTAAGYSFIPAKIVQNDKPQNAEPTETYLRRHEILSGIHLNPEGPKGSGCVGVSAVVAGHHGKWRPIADPLSSKLEKIFAFLSGQSPENQYHSWFVAASYMKNSIQTLFSIPATIEEELIEAPEVPLLTGCVVIADWLASAEHSVQNSVQLLESCSDSVTHDIDWERYRDTQRTWFLKQTEQHLGRNTKTVSNPEKAFGFKPDRKVQQLLIENPNPGLTVVCVPTGEGKTEAAVANWILHSCKDAGFLFALPTMATSNAMFERVRDMFRRGNDTPGTTSTGALLHSMSAFNTFYSTPKNHLKNEAELNAFAFEDIQDEGISASDWLRGKHRGLLSSIAVGTVDQLLAATLKHKYNFLRLLGVAQKTVILDEVHSYDPYMLRLLERYLQWASHMKTEVIILSATLPKETLDKLLKAYNVNAVIPEETVYPAVYQTAQTGDVSVESFTSEDSQKRSITLQWKESSNSKTASFVETLTQAVVEARRKSPAAKIGVIVNTVGKAQRVYDSLLGVPGFESLQVVHSRFTQKDRDEGMLRAETSFGKNSDSKPSCLISTQVVEQSVDFDFDLLITEFCPAGSLIQRLGRLHRHSRERPSGAQTPEAVLVYTDYSKVENPNDLLPYAQPLLSKTLEQGFTNGEKNTLNIPADTQTIVDAANVTFEDLEVYSGAYTHMLNKMSDIRRAIDAMIPSPEELHKEAADGLLSAFSTSSLDQPEYATRLIKETNLRVVLKGPSFWSGDLSNAEAVLKHSLTVTGFIANRLLTDATKENSHVKQLESTHALLRNMYEIDLSNCEWLAYSSEKGLYTKTVVS